MPKQIDQPLELNPRAAAELHHHCCRHPSSKKSKKVASCKNMNFNHQPQCLGFKLQCTMP
jgi:hypothetical protein